MMESAKLKMGSKAKGKVITRLNCWRGLRTITDDTWHNAQTINFDQLAGSEALEKNAEQSLELHFNEVIFFIKSSSDFVFYLDKGL